MRSSRFCVRAERWLGDVLSHARARSPALSAPPFPALTSLSNPEKMPVYYNEKPGIRQEIDR